MPAKIMGGLAELYVKPTTGQVIVRKIGIDTSSESWRAHTVPRITTFAEKMKGNNIAGGCKGKKFHAFKACLRMAGREHWNR
jgi:hypothetical protein